MLKRRRGNRVGLFAAILCAAVIGGLGIGCGRLEQSRKSQKATEAMNRGLARFKAKDYKGAIKDYTEAIESDPGDAVIYYNRGLAHADAGQHQEAIADFTRALERKPDYVEALVERSRAYVTNQEYRKAQDDVERARKLDPKADVDNVPQQMLSADKASK